MTPWQRKHRNAGDDAVKQSFLFFFLGASVQKSTHRRSRHSQSLLVRLLGKVHRDPIAGGDQPPHAASGLTALPRSRRRGYALVFLLCVCQETVLRFPQGGPKEGKGTGLSSEGTVFQLFPVIPPSLNMRFNPAKSSRTNPGLVT